LLALSYFTINLWGRVVAAYFICTMTIHDAENYKNYTALTPATIARYGGKFLTRGDAVTTVEGPEFFERLVILEFPLIARRLCHGIMMQIIKLLASLGAHPITGRMILQDGRDNKINPDPKI